jgi:RHS repeat-associated protein
MLLIDSGRSGYTHLYDKLGNLTSTGGALYSYGPQSSSCPQGALDQPHAVVSAMGHSYCYDGNGNMVRRTPNAGGATRSYVYDAENRLTHVADTLNNSVSILAQFVYDGDGNRVKKIEGGATTLYIGNYFEMGAPTSGSEPCTCPPGMNCLDVQCPLSSGTTISSSNTVMRRYYYAGATRVAMREEGTLYYLLGDHLGSAAVTASSAGAKVAELRYRPWGETRFSSGTTPTQRRFTGQLLDTATDLYHYGARYYDPLLGRFIQADTIVPEPGNPQALNRYSYTYNNPVRYIDPDGHAPRPPRPGQTVYNYIFTEMKQNALSLTAATIRLANGLPVPVSVQTRISNLQLINRVEGKVAAFALWTSQVAYGGNWDHKRPIAERYRYWQSVPGHMREYFYDVWSNIHYGYVGIHVGFSVRELLDGAGGAQFLKSVFTEEQYREAIWSGRVGLHTSFDWSTDQAAINLGIYLYYKYGLSMTEEQFLYELGRWEGLETRPLFAAQ